MLLIEALKKITFSFILTAGFIQIKSATIPKDQNLS